MTGVLRRLSQMAGLLLLMSFAIFVLIGLMPGDPVDLMVADNPRMTPEDVARLRALHGLDRPLVARYWSWLCAALAGDLGYSRLYGVPVLSAVWPRFVNTFLLLGAALVVTAALAVPLGALAARRRGTGADRAVSFFTLAGMSAPPFWTALVLICVFSAWLGWLPASAGAGDLKSLVLPVLALVLPGLAAYARHARGAMIDALALPCIRTARAKGCSEGRVVWGHAFPSAAAPVVTLFMLDLGSLCGGAVTVETVFAYPGMGRLLYDAVMGNDYNLALCAVLVLTAAVFAANMAADGLCALIDPRRAA